MPTPDQKNKQPGWSTFKIEQKVAIVIFLFTSLVGLGLSVFYLKDELSSPFDIAYSGEKFETITDRERRELIEQKEKDTDQDGINDYDELNVYRTSPYLADSDSDGFSDSQEIKSGDNPNCPVGQTCGRDEEKSANTPFRAADTRNPLPFEDAGLGGMKIETKDDIEKVLGALTTESIREALLKEGIDKETLDQLTDEELREMFDTALKELDNAGEVDNIIESAQ